MVFPVVGGDGKPTGYEIENSLRFWNGDYLKDTSFGTGTNRKKFTFSYWIKPTDLDTGGNPSLVYSNDSNDHIGFDGDNKFIFADSGSIILKTNRVFKDVSAWYHIVLAVDTTQGTAGNRYKLYVNGTQETSLETDAGISQNTDLNFHNNETHSIGRNQNDGTDFLYAYLSEFHAIDGQQLDASYFGETNDNGVWVPKEYTGTYGNNGIFMEFKQSGTGQSSSSMGADTSGNDNHFVTVALDATNQTTDTPTNNFATLNPLSEISTSVTFSEGNTKASIGNGSTNRTVGNMGFTSGKWYYEVKYISTSASASYLEVGFVNTDISMRYHVRGSDGERWDNGSPSSSTSYRHDPGDIIGVYIDADNKKWYIQVNGSNEDVGNGTADVSAGTGFVHQNFAVTDFILPYNANASGSGGHVYEVNFGNAPFSISSSNSDANGYGSFEYNPTNDGVDFYALCTKNLAEYG